LAGQRIDRLVDLERRIAMLQAEQTRVLAVIDRADISKEHWCQESVMCALRVSASAAQTRLKTARTLTDTLPTWEQKVQHAKHESDRDRIAHEDRDYLNLERRLLAEVEREHHAGRTGHQQSAQRALDLAQDRRRHQLRTREDPDHIPF
jgi:hypothetical protein